MNQPYSTPYLQKGNCNTKQFLKDVSIIVRTDGLYDVVDTCYNHEGFDNIAIQLKIMD
jgi:hypothetical protein